MLGMLGLFEYLPKNEAEIQLIQTREQLIQARIRFCIQSATTAVSRVGTAIKDSGGLSP